MRHLLIAFLVFTATTALSQTQYASGFEDGFKNGYCYNQGVGCIPPIAPIAPLPQIGESASNYTQGYNRGFIVGREKQQGAGSSSNYTTSDESLSVYGQPSYIPQVKSFTPDFNFYMKALDRAQQMQQKQQMVQQQQMLYQQYIANQAYQQRVAYIQNVRTEYQSMQNKPDSLPDGYYTVFVTALNDYKDQIKVYVENDTIRRYYWDNFYEASVLSSTKVEEGKAIIRIEAQSVRTGDMEVYFMEYLRNPQVQTSPPMKPAFVVLYGADKKKALKYHLYVGNFYLGQIGKLFPDRIPNYGEEGAVSFYLKPGNYQIGIRKDKLLSTEVTFLHVRLQENKVVAYKIDD